MQGPFLVKILGTKVEMTLQNEGNDVTAVRDFQKAGQ